MSFQIELNEKQVTVKLVNKKNVKHCYIRVLKEDLIEIKSNIYFSLYDAKILVEKNMFVTMFTQSRIMNWL